MLVSCGVLYNVCDTLLGVDPGGGWVMVVAIPSKDFAKS